MQIFMSFYDGEIKATNMLQLYAAYNPPTKSEGYSFGVVSPSALFVRPEPYLSTFWSDLIHSWYKL